LKDEIRKNGVEVKVDASTLATEEKKAALTLTEELRAIGIGFAWWLVAPIAIIIAVFLF
jgi:hypothetical protein